MVNIYSILTAIKKILDEDNTLRNLLGVSGSKDSKVFVGNEMTNYIPPSIQIPMMSDEMNNVTEESEITFYINIYSHATTDKTVDHNEISNIAGRIKVLIHNRELSVTDHQIFSMYIEGQNPVIIDRSRPDTFMGGIRCRMFAINYS